MTEKTAAHSSPDKEPVLLTHLDGRGVLTLTLNRPDKRNAINEAMVDALLTAFKRAYDDPHVKVVVLQATGKVFSAGMDLPQLAQKIRGSEADFKAFVRKYVELFYAIDQLQKKTKPIIGILQGDALGVGCTLALLCDFVVASKEAKIGYPEKDFGSKPWISGYYAMRKMGPEKALKFFRSGEASGGIKLLDDYAIRAPVRPEDLTFASNAYIDITSGNPAGFSYLFLHRRSHITLPTPEHPDDYDAMAKKLVDIHERDNLKAMKKLSVDQFTEEMYKPEIADAIESLFKKRKQDFVTLVPQPPPTPSAAVKSLPSTGERIVELQPQPPPADKKNKGIISPEAIKRQQDKHRRSENGDGIQR